jgi:hemerythrin-like domain-containing protein
VKALDIIRSEHRSLSAVLHTLQVLARAARERRLAPDFALMRLIVDYLESFHQRFHHPKEAEHLFKALRGRAGEAHGTLAKLEREHAQSDERLAVLRGAIDAAQSGAGGLDELASVVEAYADFHWRHMRTEEDLIMPLAERELSGEDWQRIDAALADNDNPVFGAARREEYRRLLAAIAEHAPPPLGSGGAGP